MMVWVPDERWTTDPAVIEGRRCRFGAGNTRRACGAPAVAALRRTHGRGSAWWCYCADHLYGRELREGIVHARRWTDAA